MTSSGESGGPVEPDDRQLLAAHLSGDPAAFATIVHRHADRLWAVAVRTTGDREEAADALQDALLSALKAATGFRGDAAVSTWLHRIVVNACLDRLRRRTARATVPLDGTGPAAHPSAETTGPDPTSAAGTRVDLLAALAALPESQRVAIVLVDVEDLPVAEVAQLLGVAEGTIKSRCARGRLALARALGEAYREGRRTGRRSAGNPTPVGGVQIGTRQIGTGQIGTGQNDEEVSR